MSNYKWDEKKIETTLHDMPKISDQRSKEDVLLRLKNDPRLRETTEPAKLKKKIKWAPIFAAAAAVVLLSILIPTFLNQSNQVSMDKAVSKNSTDHSTMDDSSESMQIESDPHIAFFSRDASTGPHYAAFPADIVDHTALHIGLATNQATIVPITFLIPDEQVEEDLGTVQPNSVALYNMYASKIDEEALGFIPYHPYNTKITSNEKQVVMKFPAEHSYDRSSATLEMLNLSIQDTFHGFDEVKFLQEDGSPITFDQVGAVSEPIPLTGAKSQQAYYRFTLENGEDLLSSNFGKAFQSPIEALDRMKDDPNDVYSSVIPKDVDFTVTESQGVLRVKFTEALDLDGMEIENATQMIEGILLTAASFDLQVEFNNVMQEQWYDFDFTSPLPKPVGANPKFLIHE